MAKHYAGGDAGIRRNDDDPQALAAKIARFGPKVLAFNGKRAAKSFVGGPVNYGRLDVAIGATALFVLPSTSGAGAAWWDEAPWQALADLRPGA